MAPLCATVMSLPQLPGQKRPYTTPMPTAGQNETVVSFKDELISDSVKHVSLLCWTYFLNNILFGLYERCDQIIHLKRK